MGRPSSYTFIWSVKPCWYVSRVNLQENRSLYWDIQQSHHGGLPDTATVHQDIRYWKLTRGFGNNTNVSRDVSNVFRSETSVLHASLYNCVQHQNTSMVFGAFWRQKTCDIWELEFTGNLFHSFVKTFSLGVNV